MTKALRLILASASVLSAAERPDLPIGSFDEAALDGWKKRIGITQEGPQKGFAWLPVREREKARGLETRGYISTQINGREARGSIVSAPFKVERRYLNFQLGGNRDLPSRLGTTLFQGDKTLNAASASDEKDPSQRLYWRTWDVSKLAGQEVAIRISDRSVEGFLSAGTFVQSDTARAIPTQAGGELTEETFRPQFHFTPLAGWMNDANGLFYYAGTWHLCFQSRAPGQAEVGWGHATSPDLLHWTQRETLLPPREGFSNFSGSAAIDWLNASGLQTTEHPPILLCYTLHPSPKSGQKATQALAFSNDGGETFATYAGNPVLQTPDFNDRDPRLFFHAPTGAWNLVLSLTKNNTQRDLATYGIFRSWDLNHWSLAQSVGPGPWYWECPDMFEIAIEGDAAHQTKWVLSKGSGDYIVGTFDGQQFTPETEPIRTQFGGSYYGAQTFTDAPSGRRVQIAWMNSGPKETTPNAYPGMSFNQQMSFPRELKLRRTPAGLRLFREPVREIAQLYRRTVQMAGRALAPGENGFAEVPASRLLDLEFTITPEQASHVQITLGGEPITYDVRGERLTAFGRTMTWPLQEGRLRLRALLDRTSLELFGHEGELTHSGVFFHDPARAENRLTVEGGPAHLERLIFRELASIW